MRCGTDSRRRIATRKRSRNVRGAVLKELAARYLIVTGCTTSVCVESTIRDAYSRDYSCILLEDCTAEPIGEGAIGYRGVPGATGRGGSNYAATLVLIETLFGWVSTADALVRAIEGVRPTAIAS